jgi:K+-transporting ATPase KdpF subunit
LGGKNERCDLLGLDPAIFPGELGPGDRMRAVVGKAKMSLLYWVAGIIAFALMVYLVFALLQPERFG